MEYWNTGKFQYSNISRGDIGILKSLKIAIFPGEILKHWNIEVMENFNIPIFLGEILEYWNTGKFQDSNISRGNIGIL